MPDRWRDLTPNTDRYGALDKGEAYRGPVALPQVVYRIDDDRYFEFVPWQAFSCIQGAMTYVDRAQGILEP